MKGKQFSIEISEEAENDFDNSYKYYFDDSPNVADAFYQLINVSSETLKNHLFHFKKFIKA